MACGIPVIAPDFSAVAEWANGAFYPLEINRDVIKTTPQNLSTIHYLPELQDCIEALELMYQSKETRERIGQLGYSRAAENRFDWDVIAHQFKMVFKEFIND